MGSQENRYTHYNLHNMDDFVDWICSIYAFNGISHLVGMDFYGWQQFLNILWSLHTNENSEIFNKGKHAIIIVSGFSVHYVAYGGLFAEMNTVKSFQTKTKSHVLNLLFLPNLTFGRTNENNTPFRFTRGNGGNPFTSRLP